MAYRRRQQGLFRYYRPPHPDAYPPRTDPSQSLAATDRRRPEGGILRGMDLPPITEREPTRWDREPNTIDHLHGQVRQVCSRDTHSRIHAEPKKEGTPGISPTASERTAIPKNRGHRKGKENTEGHATIPLSRPQG